MPTFNHVQEAKKSLQLPTHEGEQIGVCLTCKYWHMEEERHEAHTSKLAQCVYPALKEYALIVSGSSGCNKWANAENSAPDAKAYAERGE